MFPKRQRVVVGVLLMTRSVQDCQHGRTHQHARREYVCASGVLKRPAMLPGVGLADNSPSEVFYKHLFCASFPFSFPSTTISLNQYRNKVGISLGRALTVQRQSGCLLGCVIRVRVVYGGPQFPAPGYRTTRGPQGTTGGATGELLRYLATILATKLPCTPAATSYKGPSRLKPPNRFAK